MTKGQIVTVLLYGGATAHRRVVAEKPNVIVVCAEEEYLEAEKEGREPSGVGFPREDVIITDVAPARKGADRIHSAHRRESMAGD